MPWSAMLRPGASALKFPTPHSSREPRAPQPSNMLHIKCLLRPTFAVQLLPGQEPTPDPKQLSHTH